MLALYISLLDTEEQISKFEHIYTKYRGLFPGYFLTDYALRTVILLAFWRSFQRVPWQMNSTLIFPVIT